QTRPLSGTRRQLLIFPNEEETRQWVSARFPTLWTRNKRAETSGRSASDNRAPRPLFVDSSLRFRDHNLYADLWGLISSQHFDDMATTRQSDFPEACRHRRRRILSRINRQLKLDLDVKPSSDE